MGTSLVSGRPLLVEPCLADLTQTILFTDLVGFTDVRTSLGDEAAHALFAEVDELIRQQVERFAGRVVKSTGDGVMAAFPVVGRAVTCAAEIQRALRDRDRRRSGTRLAVRVGINTGDVIAEGDDLHGHAVNAAARITAKADGGEVLVSDVVKLLAGSAEGVAFADRGRFRLKGFPDRIRLHRVVWAEAGATALPALERTAFVGRDRELSEVRRFLDAALRGTGGMVWVQGEPGMGKTRLAEEVAAEARTRGALTFVGRAYDAAAVPLGPLVEILEQALQTLPAERMREILGEEAPQVAKLLPEVRLRWPDVPPAFDMPPEQERRFLLNSLRDVLERVGRATPLVLTFDDLQWADESTVGFLAHAAERLPKAAVLVLATIREGEVAPGGELQRARDALVRSRLAHLLQLGPLSLESVGAMASAMAGRAVPEEIVVALHRETAGNPFFVEEVFRHLAESGQLQDESGAFRQDAGASGAIPESVRVVIDRRLDRLDQRTRRLLTAAAVAGRASSLELLEAIGQIEGDALLDAVDEAERAGVLLAEGTGVETRFAFAHELIRQSILAGLTVSRVQQLHGRVAEALERIHGNRATDHATEIAQHLRDAGSLADRAKRAHFLRLAGERALDTGDFPRALADFEEATELTPDDDRAAHAHLAFGRGKAQRSLGLRAEALREWDSAMAGFADTGEPHLVGIVAREAVRSLAWNFEFPTAADMAERGLLAVAETDSQTRIVLLAYAGNAMAWMGRHSDGDDLLEQAIALAQRAGDERGLALVWSAAAAARYASNRLRLTLEASERAAPILRAAGELWTLCDMLPFAGWAHVLMGHFERAETTEEDALELAVRLGHGSALDSARRGRGLRTFLQTGDLAAYRRHGEEALELERAAGIPWVFMPMGVIAASAFWTGDWDAGMELMREAVAVDLPSPMYGWHAGFLALMHAYRKEPDDARRILEEHAWLLPEPGSVSSAGAWFHLSAAVEARWVLGDHDAAAGHYVALRTSLATGTNLTFGFGQLTERMLGISASAGGRWDVAEDHFARALRQAHEFPVVIEQPEVRRFHAEMLLKRDALGDRERAAEMLAEAIEQYRALSMPRHGEMAQALLARARSVSAAAPTGQAPSANAFRREGEFWTLAFGGEVTRLKDSRGLGYMHTLVREPGREFHVLDLVSPGSAARDGDVGAVLDERARASYKQRLSDLAEELEEAETFADPERAARAREEIDALTDQLTAAAGLGGKARTTGSTAERARVAVRNAIASALKTIERHHTGLAAHLRNSIKTGTFCSYAPEAPVDWML